MSEEKVSGEFFNRYRESIKPREEEKINLDGRKINKITNYGSTIVTISKYWNSPEITTVMTTDKIALKIDIEDFKKALKEEIGSVKWIFRNSSFRKRVDEAFFNVLEKIKEESIKTIIYQPKETV